MIDKIITLENDKDVYVINQIEYLDRKFVLISEVDKETEELSDNMGILEIVVDKENYCFAEIEEKEILLEVGKLLAK